MCRSGCSDAWAHTIAGNRLSLILGSNNYTDMINRLASASATESVVGFTSHVHTEKMVLADPDESQVGVDTREWLAKVGISSSEISHGAAGYDWIYTPAYSRYTSAGTYTEPRPHYLLLVPVPIEDRLTSVPDDGVVGVDEKMMLIVAVSAGTPLPQVVGRTSCGSYDYPCIPMAEYQAKCDASSTMRADRLCPRNTSWSMPVQTSSAGTHCMAAFYDTAPFGRQSAYGLSAWNDVQQLQVLCGCAAGYELAFLDNRACPMQANGKKDVLCELHATPHPACVQVSIDRTTELLLYVILPIVIVLLIAFLIYRHFEEKKIKGLKQQLEDFEGSVVGIRTATVDFDPRDGAGYIPAEGHEIARAADGNTRMGKAELVALLRKELSIPAGNTDGEVAMIAADVLGIDRTQYRDQSKLLDACHAAIFGEVFLAPAEAPAAIDVELGVAKTGMWYWQEDASMLSKHNPRDVLHGTDFVAFSGSVTHEIEQAYLNWSKGTGSAEITLDLNDRIGSTGTEAKAQKNETGAVFKVNFSTLTQKNAKSGFQRKVQRVEIEDTAARVVADAGGVKRSQVTPAGSTKVEVGEMPADLTALMAKGEAEALIVRVGQLIQISKQRPDGWAYGSVVLDTIDRPPIGVDGLNTSAGWFPMKACTEPATQEQLKELQAQLGGGDGANEALKPPTTWSPLKDPMACELFTVPDGPEKKAAVAAFMKTLSGNIQVVEVKRVQNVAMWQSFAVKRQTILKREEQEKGHEVSTSTYERCWLFHGTDGDTVPAIIETGFNRSFAGKNATAFGKGVYFARDASYSSSSTYSRPNDQGVQHMFLVRVVVGQYCLGKRDQLTPDSRKGHLLYDTTVNNVSNPSIYVAYHDAQYYPEYLVKFKQ